MNQACKSLLMLVASRDQTNLYSAKFSRVFNFANFANIQLFAKIFQKKFLTPDVQCAHAANSLNEITIHENLDPRNFSAIQ